MSGSKKGLESGDDIAARISASIGAGNPSDVRSAASGSSSLNKPRPVVIKSIKTLAPSKSQTELDDDELDKNLPQTLEVEEGTGFRPDLLWVITAFIVILMLAASFFVFMMITSTPRTETNRRLMASPSASVDVNFSGQPPVMIGDGNIPSPTPSPSPTAEPTPMAIQATPFELPLVSLAPPPVTSATLAPPPRTVQITPPPLRPPSIAPPKLPVKPTPDTSVAAYQVMVGPFDTKTDAEGSSTDLADLGKAIKVQQDKDKFWLLMGDAYPVQDDALSMAEQVVQRGKQVVIKKKQ